MEVVGFLKIKTTKHHYLNWKFFPLWDILTLRCCFIVEMVSHVKGPILYSLQFSPLAINLSQEAVRTLYENRNVLYPLFLSFTVCYFEQPGKLVKHKPQCKIMLGIQPHSDSATIPTMASTIDMEHAGLLFLTFLVSWAPSFTILFQFKGFLECQTV